jgi:hypothetical protein
MCGEGEEQTVNSQPSSLTCFQKVSLEVQEREREREREKMLMAKK